MSINSVKTIPHTEKDCRCEYCLKLSTNKFSENSNELIEGKDFYFENGLMVFTGNYHLKRGYCCKSGCRHCPYT